MIKTKYLSVDSQTPDPLIIKQAAEYIRAGELLAFPTETVYGLGADAMQAAAVEKVFLAKGRPADHPLLIHISRIEQVEMLAADIPDIARQLMERFWPGPLSIILPAGSLVPEIVRGGKIGVGFRMPSHPVSIALINAAGPIAAPSANRYGRPSPTSADHVRQDLDGRIAAVLDAGETGTGLESTIVDLCSGCQILRRGGVAVEEIEELLGQRMEIVSTTDENSAYNIKVKVILSQNQEDFIKHLQQLQDTQKQVGLVYIEGSPKFYTYNFTSEYKLDLAGQGNSIFTILRDAEARHLDVLLIEPIVNSSGITDAIIDRIKRAQTK